MTNRREPYPKGDVGGNKADTPRIVGMPPSGVACCCFAVDVAFDVAVDVDVAFIAAFIAVATRPSNRGREKSSRTSGEHRFVRYR